METYIKNLLAFNFELALFIHPKRLTISELVKLVEEGNTEFGPSPISRKVVHSIRSGSQIPGIDKLFILGAALNVEPYFFLEPRDSKLLDKFISLSTNERRDLLRLFIDEGFDEKYCGKV